MKCKHSWTPLAWGVPPHCTSCGKEMQEAPKTSGFTDEDFFGNGDSVKFTEQDVRDARRRRSAHLKFTIAAQIRGEKP